MTRIQDLDASDEENYSSMSEVEETSKDGKVLHVKVTAREKQLRNGTKAGKPMNNPSYFRSLLVIPFWVSMMRVGQRYLYLLYIRMHCR